MMEQASTGTIVGCRCITYNIYNSMYPFYQTTYD